MRLTAGWVLQAAVAGGVCYIALFWDDIDYPAAGECDGIGLQVTEAEVAQHFADCGQIMDCRVCGDPNSAMRFAFIEFREEASVMQVGDPPIHLYTSECLPCHVVTTLGPPTRFLLRLLNPMSCCIAGFAAELVPPWEPSSARHTLKDCYCTCQE